MNRLFSHLLLSILLTMVAGLQSTEADEPATTAFDQSNLVAWCIVPFDAAKRTPTERAEMLVELGLKRCAYDWRAQHVAEFEDEIREYQKHGIEFFAFWSEHETAFQLFAKYDLHPQIWRTLPSPDRPTQEERVAAAVASFVPLAKRAAKLKCRVGLYNHGGWGGEPENLVAVCRALHELGHQHVGIVYNFHHGHGHIDDFAASLKLMQPYLICLNINGMNRNAQPKIVPLGDGQHEQPMLQAIVDAEYSGPIGILDHRNELDAKLSLKQNLDGLDRLFPKRAR